MTLGDGPKMLPIGVKANYEKCVFTDGTSTFNVFDNYKCKSSFAQVAQDNIPAYTYTDFQFNFVAFAFVNQQAASYDLVRNHFYNFFSYYVPYVLREGC